MLVKVLKTCFVDGGLRPAGTQFDWSGEGENPYLVPVNPPARIPVAKKEPRKSAPAGDSPPEDFV